MLDGFRTSPLLGPPGRLLLAQLRSGGQGMPPAASDHFGTRGANALSITTVRSDAVTTTSTPGNGGCHRVQATLRVRHVSAEDQGRPVQ